MRRHIIPWLGIPAGGTDNLTAPNPVSNRDFAHTLVVVLKVPSSIHTRGFVLQAMLGEMADALLLSAVITSVEGPMGR